MSMKIYEAMAAVMEDCGAVTKDSTNQKQKYKYRGIDSVMNALNPALRKNKVFVVPEVIEQQREERASSTGGVLIYSITKVKYTFYADDGSSVSAVVIGEGMDSGDKSMNKAMSAAFKYACFQAFCIPTEEMRDSEEDSPDPAPKTEREKMIDEVLRCYEPDRLQVMLHFYKCDKVEDLLDHQLKTAYENRRKKKNESSGTNRPAN